MAKSRIDRDDFKKVTTLTGAKILYGRNDDLTWQKYALIAEQHDGSSAVNYFLEIKTQRGHGEGWAFWEYAFDQSGTRFPLHSNVAEAEPSGIVFETASASISRAYLDAISQTGTRWRVYGRHAQHEFPLEPKIIEAFLRSCDQQFSKPQPLGSTR